MILSRLRSFCCVYEQKSFHKAAESLHISQSAISQQVAAIEKQFDTKLFRRLGRTIAPTPEAKALYGWGLEIIKTLDSIPDRFRAMKNLEYGDLIIGITPLVGSEVLPSYLRTFRDKYPQINIILKNISERFVLEELRSGSIDIAIIDVNPGWRKDSLLEYSLLSKDRLALIVPGDHRWNERKLITPRELEKEVFIHVCQDTSLRDFVEDFFKQSNVCLKQFVEAGDYNEAIRLVEAGAGVSVISRVAAEYGLKLKVLSEISLEGLEFVSRKILVVQQRNVDPSYASWAFLRHLDLAGRDVDAS